MARTRGRSDRVRHDLGCDSAARPDRAAHGEEPGAKILLGILMPFGAYLAAEYLHASGILAAVAAGITMSYAEQRLATLPATRMRCIAVWDMIQFGLNGAMFVLLGEQLPTIAESATEALREAGTSEPLMLLAYIVAVTAAIIALRFAWVWVSFRFTLFRRRRAGQATPHIDSRILLVTSFAGVRGSITLAGILTLPLTANDAPFPGRDLAILIAAGVMILSMVLAGVLLPVLLRDLHFRRRKARHVSSGAPVTRRPWPRSTPSRAHSMRSTRSRKRR